VTRDHACRIGVDVGGTFTDLVLVTEDGSVARKKLLSTSGNYAEAIFTGIREVLHEAGIARDNVKELIHGTTVATNAIIERRGARTGLVTTEGFRDLLEIGRLRLMRLYDMDQERPAPLVRRRWRFEVAERLDHRGQVIHPLDRDSLERAITGIAAENIESVAVCLIHSYANPAHERAVAAAIRQQLPEVYLTLSSDVTGTLANNTPLSVSIPRSGQNARLTFSGTAGQLVGLERTQLVTVPAKQALYMYIYKPDGTTLVSTNSGAGDGEVLSATLPTTGTYTVFLDANYAATSSFTLTLNPPGELTIDGPPLNITTLSGESHTLSFVASTAGVNLGLGMTGLTDSPASGSATWLYVYRGSDGALISSVSCLTANPGGGCGLNLPNLAQADHHRAKASDMTQDFAGAWVLGRGQRRRAGAWRSGAGAGVTARAAMCSSRIACAHFARCRRGVVVVASSTISP